MNKSSAPTSKDGVDYIKMFRDAPPHLLKKSSIEDLKKRVLEARAEKLKKAS